MDENRTVRCSYLELACSGYPVSSYHDIFAGHCAGAVLRPCGDRGFSPTFPLYLHFLDASRDQRRIEGFDPTQVLPLRLAAARVLGITQCDIVLVSIPPRHVINHYCHWWRDTFCCCWF